MMVFKVFLLCKDAAFSPQHPPVSSCSSTCCSRASGWLVCCTPPGGSSTMTHQHAEAARCLPCVPSNSGTTCEITSPLRWVTVLTLPHRFASAVAGLTCLSEQTSDGGHTVFNCCCWKTFYFHHWTSYKCNKWQKKLLIFKCKVWI